MSNANDLANIVDKNIGRFVEAVEKLGPSAEYMWSAMVGAALTGAVSSLLINLVLLVIACALCLRYFPRVDSWDNPSPAGVVSMVISIVSGVFFVVSVLVFCEAFSGRTTTILYPEAAVLNSFLQ